MSDPAAADTGFLPRVLLCEPPSTIGTRLVANARSDEAELEAFTSRLREILDTPMPADPETRELHPRILPLIREARGLLAGFADAIEAAQGLGGDLAHITGTASKAAEQAARIAGVLTLWRDLSAPAVEACDGADTIEMTQFYLGEASRLASAATVSPKSTGPMACGAGCWKADRKPRSWRARWCNSGREGCVKARRHGLRWAFSKGMAGLSPPNLGNPTRQLTGQKSGVYDMPTVFPLVG